VTKGGITGTYDYTVTPEASCPSGYTTTPGPHAVRRTGTSGNYRQLCYDRNGNQTRGWNYVLNRQRTQTWKSYNLPATITEDSTTIAFSYGADRARFRQVNGFASQTTIYVEGLFEREIVGATSTAVHYILAGGQAVAVFSSNNSGATSTRYLHRDHLGSVTHVTNETGGVVETLAYDAWGKRRNANWTDMTGLLPLPTLRRPGYTGHEGLNDIGIVHMNGRIYDPSLGRMLSADPYVQFPGYAQSYNRYSYVLNNPVRYTDPSGFFLSGWNESFVPWERGGGMSGGRVSGRPRVGVTTTVTASRSGGGGFSGGFGGGFGGGGCATYPECDGSGILESGGGWSNWSVGAVDAISWTVQVFYTSYPGVIADDSGESTGGAIATQTVAAYEQRLAAPSVSPMVAGGRCRERARRSVRCRVSSRARACHRRRSTR
jgi:RHS repeat-associated protein